jgi:phosphatidate phosphatase PAH1
MHHALVPSGCALVLICSLGACGDGGPTLPDCVAVKQVLVTDIDETLTTSDAEFVLQILDPNHDPARRAGGPELMQSYAERGYVIHYLTARARTIALEDGTPCEQATREWLERHGFPWGEGRAWLSLADELVTGEATATYKAAAIQARQAEGYTYAYAYGNATTDIEAYALAGIPKANTFIVGVQAGAENTRAIAGEDFIQHAAEHLPLVPAVCAFR